MGDKRIVLYTTHCPKCIVLERKLREKGVTYEEETNVDVMIEKGFTSSPQLEKDGEMLDFSAAMVWLRTL